MRKSRIKRIVAQLMAVALLCTQIPQMNKEVYADTIEKRMDAVESIVLGGAHSAAVTKNGDLYCWGSNICGQIGNGTTINQLTPTKIMNNVKKFFSENGQSAAITNGGDLYCWGDNAYGQIGNGTKNNQLKPVKILNNVKDVFLQYERSAAVTNGGDLYCWGYNYGTIGNGTTTNQLAPVKVLENVESVFLGKYHSAAVTKNGDLYCWGENSYGAVGNGTTANQLTPTKVLSNIKEVSLGNNYSLAVTKNGNLYCWGRKRWCGLGEAETEIGQLTPVKVLSNVDNIYTGFTHSAAVTKNGDMYCWGEISSKEFQLTPVKVLSDVKSVSLSWFHDAAVTQTGDLYCWGSNDCGCIGIGMGVTTNQLTPVKVMSNIESVSLAAKFSAAVTQNSNVYCWGDNSSGQIGIGTTTNKFTPTKIELNIQDGSNNSGDSSNTYQGSSDANNVNFKFGSKTEMIIPSDVPVIGGGKIGLDFGNVPVKFERKGNKFKIGLGVKDLKDLSDNGWWTFKKFVDTQNKEYKKGIENLLASQFGIASMGWSVKPKISCYGYLEGTITDKGIQSEGGKLSIEISVKASKEWQTVVVVVPVVLQTSAEVGIKRNMPIGADFSKQSVYINGDLDLTLPKIRLSSGVGVAYVCDVSVYGQATNNVKWAQNGNLSATISGEIGVSAKALCFSYEQALLKGEMTYFNNFKAKAKIADDSVSKQSSDNAMEIKVDDTKVEKWNRSSVARAINANEEITLQNDIYDAAKPKVLRTENGKTIITYIEAVKNRSEGNQYVVVYSIYDEETGTWSTPTIVDDDGTADFNLETVSNGNNVYFVWSNLKDEISSDEIDTLDSKAVAAKCKIEYAKLDTDTMKISSEQITSNNNLDTIPNVFTDGEKVYVGWVENQNNDVLNLEGTNKIHFGEITEKAYTEKNSESFGNPIKQVTIGKLGDNVKLAYIEKADEKDSLSTMDLSGNISNIQMVSGNIENATFSKIDGKDSLLWYSNENETGTINCLDAEQMSISKILENNQINSNYYIVKEGKRDILITSAVEDNGKSQVLAYVIGQDQGNVQLINSEDKIGNVSAIYDNGKYTLLYTDTVAEIGENSVDTTTDLKIKSLEQSSVVQIESVDYLAEEVIPNNDMTITAQIKNDGLENENTDVNLVAYYDEAEIGRTTVSDIQVGEERNVDINISLPDNLTKNSNITIKAIKQDEIIDTYKEEISLSDLELSVNEIISNKSADVKVKNNGAFATEATLYVYDKDEEGTVLNKYDCGNLQFDESYNVHVDLSEYSDEGTESVMFVVKSDNEEIFQYNNSYSMYIGNDVLKDIDYIQASKLQTEYYVGEQINLSDITMEAVYMDGSIEKKENYETNIDSIDTSTAGTKTLTITYEEVGEVRTVDIPIQIKSQTTTSQTTTDKATTKQTESQTSTSKVTTKPTESQTTTDKATTKQTESQTTTDKVTTQVESQTTTDKVTTKQTESQTTTDEPTTKVESHTTMEKTTTSQAESQTVTDKSTNATESRVTTKKPTINKNVKPKKVQKLTAKNVKKKRVSLKWRKVIKAKGYQIQYALDRKFKKSGKIKKTAKVSYIIKKLKKKKTYYIRVRAYVINNGKKVYGSWSKTKKIKIKR